MLTPIITSRAFAFHYARLCEACVCRVVKAYAWHWGLDDGDHGFISPTETRLVVTGGGSGGGGNVASGPQVGGDSSGGGRG